MNALTPLKTLSTQHAHSKGKPVSDIRRAGLLHTSGVGSSSNKVNLLCAVLEVEGPDTITIRKGPESGKQVSVLRLVLGQPFHEPNEISRQVPGRDGRTDVNVSVYKRDSTYAPNGDEQGNGQRLPVIAKLTAWRETAELWGGRADDVGVVRGDIVYIQSTSPVLSFSRPLHSLMILSRHISFPSSPKSEPEYELDCTSHLPRLSLLLLYIANLLPNFTIEPFG